MARSTSSVIWKIILGILVALLVLLLVAEFGLRWFIGSQLREDFRAQAEETGVSLTQDPTISFGATPLVFSAVSGTVDGVEITTPSTLSITRPGGEGSVPEIAGQPGAHVVLDDLRISDPDNPVAAHMVTTTEVPEDFLLATVQRSMAEQQGGGEGGVTRFLQELIQITDLNSNVAEGTLDVEFTGGAAQLSLRPVPTDGQLTFEATDAALFGISLPEQVSDAITTGLREGVSEQAGDLDIETFEVIEDGVRIVVTGENVNLRDVAGSSSTVE